MGGGVGLATSAGGAGTGDGAGRAFEATCVADFFFLPAGLDGAAAGAGGGACAAE